MSKYVRKFTACLVCGSDIKRGKYCKNDKIKAYRIRQANYYRRWYQLRKNKTHV